MQGKKLKRSIFSLLLACVFFLSGIPLVFAQADYVSDFAELLDALGDPAVETIQLSNAITIDANSAPITIDGDGKTIYAAYGSRHFNITGDGTVSISNLTLVGNHNSGSDTESGGGIYTEAAELNLADVTIQNCANMYGGAIEAASDTVLNVTDCNFSENSACIFTDGCLAKYSGYGGAIYSNGTVAIDGETVISNNVATNGGGIYGDEFSSIQFISGTIEKNIADKGFIVSVGGGIACTGDLTVTGGEIRDNVALLAGGGIVCVGNAEISGGVIDGNEAIIGGGVAILDPGSLIEFENPGDSTLTVSGDTVISNNTAALGGGIAAGNAETLVTSITQDPNTEDSDAKLNVIIKDEAQIIDNEAAFLGGGLMGFLADISVLGGTLQENTAQYGGGIALVSDGYLNSSEDIEGAMYLPAGGSLTVSGGSILDNLADECGGGIFATGVDVSVSGGEITGNSAQYGGGIGMPEVFEGSAAAEDIQEGLTGTFYYYFSGEQTNFEFTGGIISGNTPDNVYPDDINDETVAYVENFTELKDALDNSKIKTIVIMNDFPFDEGEVLTIDRSIILRANGNEDVTLTSAPGERHFTVTGDSITVTFKNVILFGDQNGGGIDSTASSLTLRNAKIESCVTQDDGGAVAAAGALVINGGEFSDNGAENGGAVFSEGTLTIQGNAEFTNNTASGDGGAVAAAGTLVINGGQFSDNSAENGGAVAIEGTLTIKGNAVFTNNTANGYGGAVAAAGTSVIDGGQFSYNSAENGGAVSIEGTLTVQGNAEFTNNTASVDGGAVYGGEDSVITLESTTITQNEAGVHGGGIASYGTVNENGGTVTDNTPDDIWQSPKPDGPVTNFQQLKDALADTQRAEILIATSFTFELQDEPLEINRNVTLKAYDVAAVTLTSAAGQRHFKVTGDSITVAFENVTLSGGQNGGGINSTASTLTLNGAKIQSCVTQGNGGAVAATGILVIDGGQFSANSAINGGAVSAEGNLTIQGNATFITNSARDYGGAIYGGKKSLITIQSAIIMQNTAGINGGAIAYCGTLNRIGGTIIGNSVEEIWFCIPIVTNIQDLKEALADTERDEILIANGFPFEETLTIDRDVTLQAYGVASVTLTSAAGQRHFAVTGDSVTVTFENVTLSGNQNGGGIDSTASSFTLKNAQIQSCKTQGNGGAVAATGTLVIDGGRFSANSAKYGGAVCVEGNLTVKGGAVFISNTARDYGGAVYGGKNRVITIESATIMQNTAQNGKGGGIASYDGTVTNNGTVIGNTPDNIWIGIPYPIVTNFQELKTALADTEFDKILIVNDILFEETLTIDRDVTLQANTGAVTLTSAPGQRHFTVTGDSITVAFENVTLSGGQNGGGIDSTATTFTLKNAKIQSCVTQGNGGAVAATGTLVIDGGQFSENSAENGGAVSIEGNLTIKGNATFTANTASIDGGAVYGGEDSVITLESTTITQNEAGVHGGGIASYGEVIENGGTVTDNTPDDIWIFKLPYDIIVTDFQELKDALANPEYAIIAIANDIPFGAETLTIDRSVTLLGLDGEVVLTSNGQRHFYVTGGEITLTFTDVTLSGNNGIGGIESAAAKLTLENAKIISCVTAGNGGAMYVSGAVTIIRGGEFSSNSAANGGAIYGAAGTDITVEGTTMSQNQASMLGGGIATEGILRVQSGSVIMGNIAILGGGIFGYTYSTVYMAPGTVDDYFVLGSVIIQ